MKTKKLYSLLFLFTVCSATYAQIGINTSNPQSTFDIVGNASSTSAKDGVTAPRVTRQQLASKIAGTYATAQAGALVYVTDATAPTGTTPSLAQTTNILEAGYYFFNGTEWRELNYANGTNSSVNIYNSNGSLTGNRIVTQAGNTLAFTSTATNGFSVDGTTFSVDAANHRLGVGTTTPETKLHVVSTDAPLGRFNLIDAPQTNGENPILALRNTSALAIANKAYIGFVNNGPSVIGADWQMGSIRTSATAGGVNQDFYVGNATTGNLNERVRITSSGNMGIGTSTPEGRFHVVSTTPGSGRYNLIDAPQGTVESPILTLRNTSALANSNKAYIGFCNAGPTVGGSNWQIGSIRTSATGGGGNEDFYVGNSTGGTLLERLRILPNSGNVGIGTSTPTEKLHVIGNILASGSVTPSDIRIKKEIVDNTYGLNEILKLRTINYKYKDERLSKDKKVGFVAQEIQKSMPELVSTANDEMKTLGVNYAEMTVVLTKAVQEQQKEIEFLKAQVKELLEQNKKK